MIRFPLKKLRLPLLALLSAAGLWFLSPAACGPHDWQVRRDWEVFVANRDECLRTVRLGPMTVATKKVHGEYAAVEIDVGGQWIPGKGDPEWLSNTPCAGFHPSTEWMQGVHRSLVYRRRNAIGWEIDLWESFALLPQQTMSWDWKKRAPDYVEESPENLER